MFRTIRKLLLAGSAYCAVCISLSGTPVLQNGGFETSNFAGVTCQAGKAPCNIEFDSNFAAGAGVVSNWTSTGYAIYFIGGKQTTQNATGQFQSSGKEMLDVASTTLSLQGGNFVAMDADPTIASTVSQTVSGFTPGQYYTINFYWAASQLQSRTGVTNEQINLTVQGSSSTDANYSSVIVTTPAQGFSNWRQEGVSFLANSAVETLTFLGKSTSTCLPPMVLLDGVTLSAGTPEPGAFVLVGTGAALLIFSKLRKRRNGKV